MLKNSFKAAFTQIAKARASNNLLNAKKPYEIAVRNESEGAEGAFVKTSMTQYRPEEGYSLQITSFSEYGFTINSNITAVGPIIIFPKTIYSWNIESEEHINEKSLSLFKHLEPKIDVLIIGTGDRYSKINPEVPKWLIQNKITNFEILPTDKAINAFNFLIGENRFVAAALMPAFIRRDRDVDAAKQIERQELYKQIKAEQGIVPKDIN